MMKKLMLLTLLVLILVPILPCAAVEVDPILLDEPNEKVFGCKNDIFIELSQPTTMSKVASGRSTRNNFILIQAEILFLLDTTWNGIDKSSFSLKWTDPDGAVSVFPLNYAISMMANKKLTWHIFSEPYRFTDLKHTNLIFEVTPYSYDGWTLVFRPTERGTGTPYCEINIPLTIK